MAIHLPRVSKMVLKLMIVVENWNAAHFELVELEKGFVWAS